LQTLGLCNAQTDELTVVGAADLRRAPAPAAAPASVADLDDVTLTRGGTSIRAVLSGSRGVVRLIGVDAPEKTGGYRDSEPYGDAATRFMRTLLDGKDVRLEYDGDRKDQYNRTLAYVYLPDGRMANVEIIRAGYAETYRRFEYHRKPEFFAAEREAKAARRGMWAKRSPGR
jgi:micrococcal nuclease